ncbi:endo-1,4-beta-xylanase [Fulvivirga ligni]|uniref:endo-1,4-beta-xylanase n=1 Tax=Fulvivirga ligni TaxID=2904246 RepID=UPI001F325AA5|nr:endo-1,4-beta-xylanase [Fulvivirga ligni]UII19584.1 endo-1,4-beta-xylanase [Fulvivirga ligni]
MKFKYRNIVCGSLIFVSMACADNDPLDFDVDKPESIAQQEVIDAYNPLKEYVGRDENPHFKLGAGVSLGEYNDQGVMYRLVNNNFDEITIGYAMKHGAIVQNDGHLDLTGVKKLVELSAANDVSIYGHTLCWHSNQNAEFLNSTIAPVVIPGDGGPTWEEVTSNDFESDDASNYLGNSNAVMSFTADGEGANSTGRALKVTNAEVRPNDWDCQLFITFSPETVVGERYTFSMDIKSDAPATFPTQAHTVPYAYKHWNFFGSLSSTTEWTTYTSEITIADNTSGVTTIAFNLGATATNYYFDNMKLTRYNEEGGVLIEEKTPEEKRDTLTYELERWIAGVMEVTKSNTKAWDVVNEPMDDGNPYELKTGIGRDDLPADNFFWQDYLGKDYAVEAFRLARKYGNEGDILFINDYNLEYNLDKCRGIIEYIKYIENQGVVVDGIGTQMHIGLDSNKDNIAEMFKLLAATGKMIKVSELDVRLRTSDPSWELLQEQAAMYKYVVDMYNQYIPPAQRYGITVWGITDSPEDSYWLPGESQSLWTLDYERKPAYAGFADGLQELK